MRNVFLPFFLTFLGTAVVFQSNAGEMPSADKWAEAAQAIVRLQPAAFPTLPKSIRTWLAREGYAVPQSCATGPHNVLSGDFEGLGRRDWAVLASRRDSSAVLVFFGGSPRNPCRLDLEPDEHYLQTAGPDSIAYSRLILVADSTRTVRAIRESGTTLSTAVVHDGIEDYFCDKASQIHYYHRGRWHSLPGAD